MWDARTTVLIPPRTLNTPSIRIILGSTAPITSFRMMLVTSSWKCPSSRKLHRYSLSDLSSTHSASGT